jgi:hypothetical protein
MIRTTTQMGVYACGAPPARCEMHGSHSASITQIPDNGYQHPHTHQGGNPVGPRGRLAWALWTKKAPGRMSSRATSSGPRAPGTDSDPGLKAAARTVRPGTGDRGGAAVGCLEPGLSTQHPGLQTICCQLPCVLELIATHRSHLVVHCGACY